MNSTSPQTFNFSGLPYSSQYEDLGDEAHKKGAVSVGAPALVSHLGMFFEEGAADPGAQTPLSRGSIIKNARAVLDLLDSRSLESQRPDRDKTEFFPDDKDKIKQTEKILRNKIDWSTTDTETVFCKIDGHMAKIIVEVHSDYFTITTIVDFSKRPPEDTLGLNHFRCFESKNTPGPLVACAGAFGAYMAQVLDPENPAKLEAALEAKQFMHNEFWSELFKILFGSLPEKFDKSVHIFADFRGLVLQARKQVELFNKEGPAKPYRKSAKKVNVELALDILKPAFNLGDKNLHMRELVACTMLREQVVYMSPLGSSVVAGNREPQKGVHVPVFYALCVSDINRWQIGRLIHRINTLGTLRLLALRDLQSIRITSLQIRNIGRKLDQVTLNGNSHFTDTKDIHKRLTAIANDIGEIGKDISGGLSYRVYRAAFFSTTFKSVVQDLDVQRIEGWQPYDEFVRRRLYSAYDFIARVGERMTRLQKRLQTKFSEVQMQNFQANTENIAEIQDKIHDSHKIQHVIELIAVGYYGGYILYYVLKFIAKKTSIGALAASWFGGTVIPEVIKAFSQDTGNYLLGACLLVSLTTGIVWFVHRRRKHVRKVGSPPRPSTTAVDKGQESDKSYRSN